MAISDIITKLIAAFPEICFPCVSWLIVITNLLLLNWTM